MLGDAVWGADDDTLESVVGAMLRERGLTLATMESCTGGLLASTITDVPGSSDYFKGGLVSYATEMKLAWGVSREVVEAHGVISAECAREMARAAREQAVGGHRHRRHGRRRAGRAGGEAGRAPCTSPSTTGPARRG